MLVNWYWIDGWWVGCWMFDAGYWMLAPTALDRGFWIPGCWMMKRRSYGF